MELKIKIDSDQLNDLIVASLIEYHQYLNNTVWQGEDDYRQTVRDALLLTLEQYMNPTQYGKYVASLLN